MSKDQQGSNTQFAKPPVQNPAPEQPDGPNTTTQGKPAPAGGHTVSKEPLHTMPSRKQVDPLQVLVDPVDEHRATLNQDFAQNRVDAQGKRYANAEGPTPAASGSEGPTSEPVPAKGQ